MAFNRTKIHTYKKEQMQPALSLRQSSIFSGEAVEDKFALVNRSLVGNEALYKEGKEIARKKDHRFKNTDKKDDKADFRKQRTLNIVNLDAISTRSKAVDTKNSRTDGRRPSVMGESVTNYQSDLNYSIT